MASSTNQNAIFEELDSGASPEAVLHKADTLGTIVLLNVPGGSAIGSDATDTAREIFGDDKDTYRKNPPIHVGLDHSMWMIGPHFLGIRRIPLGAHFLYWSWGEDGLRMGRFVFFSGPSEVLVFRWDHATEGLIPADPETADRWSEAVYSLQLEPHFGPYPTDYEARWRELALFISGRVVDRLAPVGRRIRAQPKEYDEAIVEQPQKDTVEEAEEGEPLPAADAQSKNGRARTTGETFDEGILDTNTIFFSEIPRPRVPAAAVAAEVTAAHLDKTATVDALLEQIRVEDDDYRKKFHNPPPLPKPEELMFMSQEECDLLGELQFAYVVFLLGQVFDGFEQWKRLLVLLCGSPGIAQKRPRFLANLIRVIYGQLESMPTDLFVDELLKDGFLPHTLGCLSDFSKGAEDEIVRKRILFLEKMIRTLFKVEVDELLETGENAPAVVDESEVLIRF